MAPVVLDHHSPASQEGAESSVTPSARGLTTALATSIKELRGAYSHEELLTALQEQVHLLQREQLEREEEDRIAGKKTGPALKMVACKTHDPGLHDLFGTFYEQLKAKETEEMTNLEVIPNDQGLVTSEFADHPAASTLFHITAEFRLTDRKRSYALIVEDMQQTYHEWVDYVQPHCHLLLQTFRRHGLPVVWSGWSRRPHDGMHGALDRFYGPRGVAGDRHGGVNPCYAYGDDGTECLPSLAPVSDDEWSRYIASAHLSKFADLDEHGNGFLHPLLRAWGVNTVVVVGAWTDDCLAATAFEGCDRYGYDVVLVSDAVATATVNGGKMLECLSGACCLLQTTDDVCAVLDDHPELVDTPRAPLRGSSRYRAAAQHPPGVK